ncbi:zincin-like metallopeptidase domain-containing protein [Aeromonas caviae]|uniref:zincin-like metallopeptidase domain-containing protein n=1 Tax=Aeromonas caviae TaxID=648 RepID=UPI00021987CE|nr:zincin-like metallopeptidase domain-containing protein [Aeromonas caviae]MDX7846597.1 zincin-like metallopeptidase domain-containing protein [Aeromonas caviae]
MEQKKSFSEVVAEKLIEQLKTGTAPWQKPWKPGIPSAFLPMNPTTGKRYKGINALYLMSQGRTDPRWMTYKQASSVGAQVLKGEKGTPVQYWKFTEERDKLGDNGKPEIGSDGKPIKEIINLERPRVFFATVFNGEQIEGLPKLQPIIKEDQKWNAVERAENILKASEAKITHTPGNRAFYSSGTDRITLPERSQFESADRYYATALHELGHWTGHSSRLDRDLGHPFGSEAYAKEELRAEISSMILGDELGIGHDPSQHAAYVGSWIKALQDDHLEIFRAAADAEKIHDYVMAFEQKQIQQSSVQQGVNDTMPQASELMSSLQADIEIIAAAKSQKDFDKMNDLAEEKLHLTLPKDWKGGIRVQGSVFEYNSQSGKEEIMAASEFGQEPYLWTLHADRGDGKERLLDRDFDNEKDAEEFAQVLRAISSLSEGVDNDQRVYESAQKGADVESKSVNIAEDWTIWQVEKKGLIKALDGASHEQINKTIEIVNAMKPVSVSNDFWSRHVLPVNAEDFESKIENASVDLESRRLDSLVSLAWKAGEANAMDEAATAALNFKLPHDWNGEVQIQGNAIIEVDGDEYIEPADEVGVEPQFWSVYAQRESGQHQFLADYITKDEAQKVSERLNVISANVLDDKHAKNVKLAEINEARVKRDPESKPEEILAAKDAVKTAVSEKFLFDNSDEGARKEPNQAEREVKERVYIKVPFSEKEEAKALGARWDRPKQSWYIPNGVDPAKFAKWGATGAVLETQQQQGQPAAKALQERIYLAVPYGERGAAKAAGAAWDKNATSWYAPPQADMTRLQRWLPENVQGEQHPAMTPRDEFAEALKSLGCEVSGDHPIMDGKKHRIRVEGDKKNVSHKSGAGFYVGHLDGHPAGYILNNRTGVEMRWKSKGYSLDPQEKAKLQAEAAEKMAERAAEQERAQEATSQRVTKQMETLVTPSKKTPYLEAKGIDIHPGVMTDRDGLKTYIPAFDATGKQWTMQFIQEDGTKRFAKDSRKEGCFHPVGGGLDAIATAPVLVVAEGYATATSLAEAMGQPTVAAFDSGNLEAVVKALHEKYPEKPVIVAGDDDRHLEMTQGVNPGRSKATAAAKAVGGKAIFPIFAPGENTYPSDLPAITPALYREHERARQRLDAAEAGKAQLTDAEVQKCKESLLSANQLSALNDMKSHTDFNDLSTRSLLGKEGLQRQAVSALTQVLELSQKTQQSIVQERKPENTHSRGVRIG